MKALAFVILCAACDDEGPIFPIEPSVGPVGTSGSNTGPMVRGRVCVIDSLITVTCASTVTDLTVTLGNHTTVTANDGTFAITRPIGANLAFTVSGPNVVTTSQALSIRRQVNVLRQAAFDEMLAINDIITPVDTGSVIATVTRGGVAVAGVTATSVPVPAFGPFFDGTGPEPWVTNATGVSGIVWFPGIMAGPAELSFNTLTGGEAIVGGVQVINGGITMVETPLP